MSIKFLVLGGGVFWVWGGGEVPILFLWARGFSDLHSSEACSSYLLPFLSPELGSVASLASSCVVNTQCAGGTVSRASC